MRKGKWKSRKGMALLALTLAFVLGLSGTGLLDTHAAGPVETDWTCSLKVDVSSLYALVEEEYTDVRGNWPEDIDQDDLNALTASQVTVHLYKVADIDASGRYTAFGFFGSLDPALNFSDEVINSETSASTWNEMALQAAEAVRNAKDKEVWDKLVPGKDKVEYSEITKDRKAEFDGLGVGLYLVVADKVETANYEYTFAPYLVSLPDNPYSRGESVENDDWLYGVTMGLKVEQTPRYGTLEIVKARTSINGMPVTASTCVFEINIETPKEETEQRIAAVDFTGSRLDTGR